MAVEPRPRDSSRRFVGKVFGGMRSTVYIDRETDVLPQTWSLTRLILVTADNAAGIDTGRYCLYLRYGRSVSVPSASAKLI